MRHNVLIEYIKRYPHKDKRKEVGSNCAQFRCVYWVQLLRNCAQVKYTCVGNLFVICAKMKNLELFRKWYEVLFGFELFKFYDHSQFKFLGSCVICSSHRA